MIKLSVGIDIAKDKFHACIMMRLADGRIQTLANKEFENGKSGFKALLSWVSRLSPKNTKDIKPIYVMESTGVYYEELAYFLSENNCSITVQLANNVKHFAKSLNQKTKTDKADAHTIAIMGIERNLDLWQMPSTTWRTLKRLCRERVAILEQKIATSNQLHAIKAAYRPCNESIERTTALIEFLEIQIQAVEIQIQDEVNANETIKAKVEKVCTIKGVKIITAVTIIAECNGFILFKNKAQLVSFAGYDVVERLSGTSVQGKARISKKGNRFIRRALHWPAQAAIRFEPEFHNYAQRITDKTAIKMKGGVAIQRKLLVLIFKLYVTDAVYDPLFQQKKQQENSIEKINHNLVEA
jgi:transposase